MPDTCTWLYNVTNKSSTSNMLARSEAVRIAVSGRDSGCRPSRKCQGGGEPYISTTVAQRGREKPPPCSEANSPGVSTGGASGRHELRLSATIKLIISALVLSLHLRPRDRLNGGIHPRHYQMAPTVNPESVDNWIESRADVPPQSSVLRGSVDRAGVCIAVHFNFLCRNVSSHQRIFLLSKKIMPSI